MIKTRAGIPQARSYPSSSFTRGLPHQTRKRAKSCHARTGSNFLKSSSISCWLLLLLLQINEALSLSRSTKTSSFRRSAWTLSASLCSRCKVSRPSSVSKEEVSGAYPLRALCWRSRDMSRRVELMLPVKPLIWAVVTFLPRRTWLRTSPPASAKITCRDLAIQSGPIRAKRQII